MAYCYDGKHMKRIKEMAEEYGIDRQRIYSFRREAGRQKMQCKCASMMCEEEVGFLNTMESYIVRLKRWLKNMDYLGIHQHIIYKGAKQ